MGAQKDIFERILNDSGTSAQEVSYVEMHGTGTQTGDAREMQSVSEVFAPENASKKRSADQSLYLGALKANIGHGEAVSTESFEQKDYRLTCVQLLGLRRQCSYQSTENDGAEDDSTQLWSQDRNQPKVSYESS